MNYEELENPIFDNPALLNRYQSIDGMRQSNSCIRPSLYICDLKMKKAFLKLTDDEIKELFKQPNAEILGIKLLRESLENKLIELQDWQTFVGLIELLKNGNYDCGAYILSCTKDDVCPYQNVETIYLLIQSL